MMKWMEKYIAPAIVALFVAGAAQGAVYQWSHTAATNATADASINWSEGMAPSSVNDSARAMMARIADWRDDFSGLIVTTGTSTAYVATTSQGIPNPPTDGQLLSIRVHATNGASPTLAVDGGTAITIRSSGGTAVPAGAMTAGTPYDLMYNLTGGTWRLKNYYGAPFEIPLGAIIDYSGAAVAPNANFVLANGQCISRTTYAAYFALVSTSYGVCDGTTTFGVPDASNRYLLGGQMGGTARVTIAGGNFDATNASAAGGAQNHTLTTAELPVTTPAGSVSTPAGTVSVSLVTGTVSTSISGQGSGVITNLPGSGPFTTPAGGANWGPVNGSTLTSASTFTGNAQSATFTGSGATFTGTSFGSGSAHSIIPPTLVVNKIVRVL